VPQFYEAILKMKNWNGREYWKLSESGRGQKKQAHERKRAQLKKEENA